MELSQVDSDRALEIKHFRNTVFGANNDGFEVAIMAVRDQYQVLISQYTGQVRDGKFSVLWNRENKQENLFEILVEAYYHYNRQDKNLESNFLELVCKHLIQKKSIDQVQSDIEEDFAQTQLRLYEDAAAFEANTFKDMSDFIHGKLDPLTGKLKNGSQAFFVKFKSKYDPHSKEIKTTIALQELLFVLYKVRLLDLIYGSMANLEIDATTNSAPDLPPDDYGDSLVAEAGDPPDGGSDLNEPLLVRAATAASNPPHGTKDGDGGSGAGQSTVPGIGSNLADGGDKLRNVVTNESGGPDTVPLGIKENSNPPRQTPKKTSFPRVLVIGTVVIFLVAGFISGYLFDQTSQEKQASTSDRVTQIDKSVDEKISTPPVTVASDLVASVPIFPASSIDTKEGVLDSLGNKGSDVTVQSQPKALRVAPVASAPGTSALPKTSPSSAVASQPQPASKDAGSAIGVSMAQVNPEPGAKKGKDSLDSPKKPATEPVPPPRVKVQYAVVPNTAGNSCTRKVVVRFEDGTSNESVRALNCPRGIPVILSDGHVICKKPGDLLLEGESVCSNDQ